MSSNNVGIKIKNIKYLLKFNYKITKIKLNPYPYSQYQKKLINKIIFLENVVILIK